MLEIESQVFGYLCDTLIGNHSGAGATLGMPAATARTDAFMAQALDFIHECYKEPIAVEDIAAIARRSRYHFIRVFKKHTARAVPVRAKAAVGRGERLLSRSERTVTDIGVSLGFSDGSAFYRAFVKFVGVSPDQYRRMESRGRNATR